MSNKRILFISASVGLGHVTRDLAIAKAIRSRIPEAEIVWLAAEPAKTFLAHQGEQLLSEQYVWDDETGVIEQTFDGEKLNLVQYMLEVREKAWRNHVAVFREITAKEHFDLVIGDEAYALSIAIKDGKVSLNSPFLMIYDFIGVDAKSANFMERIAAYLTNRGWIRTPPPFLHYCYVGQLEDITDRRFGFLLPNRRKWAQTHCRMLGYILRFAPNDYRDKEKFKAELGYDERPLIIASIGGTSVGQPMLQLLVNTFDLLKEEMPALQMVLVCGPRVDPASVPRRDGLQIKGMVPDLYRHFAACDLAIVQGGNTSTIELTALGKPFIFFPIEGHFEHELIVERQKRLRAGVPLRLSETSPTRLAEKVIETINRPANYADIPTDGAQKAAQMIMELLGSANENRFNLPLHERETTNN